MGSSARADNEENPNFNYSPLTWIEEELKIYARSNFPFKIIDTENESSEDQSVMPALMASRTEEKKFFQTKMTGLFLPTVGRRDHSTETIRFLMRKWINLIFTTDKKKRCLNEKNRLSKRKDSTR